VKAAPRPKGQRPEALQPGCRAFLLERGRAPPRLGWAGPPSLIWDPILAQTYTGETMWL
jgi:hypothetical protein